MTDEPWSWPDVAREVRPLVEQLTPEEAKRVLVILFAETLSKEEYVAARLSGIIRGTIGARSDEAKRRRPC